LQDGDRTKIHAVFQSESACFSELVSASGLNPAADFRFADLSSVSFAGSDIRGYDFTGANLSNTQWKGAIWNNTTIVDGARLDGAIGFADDAVDEPSRSIIDKIVNGAVDLLRFGRRESGRTVLDQIVDGQPEATVVTDPGGNVLYANAAYLALADAVDAVDVDDVPPVERVFIGDRHVSEAVYRLSKAAREDRRLQEEVRMPGSGGEAVRWLRFRVRPLGEAQAGPRSTVWTIADITPDRESQELVFQELQHAIDNLEDAPAGFCSIGSNGEVLYLNGTLAAWLDYDLEKIGSRGLKLADIMTGDAEALLTAVAATPGEVKTEVLDLDLKTRSGRIVPARLFHKVTFGPDGTPGASRTLVLNRERGDENDPQRAAEVRFVRFFHNTPMAITSVDRSGRVARINAPFARLHRSLIKGKSSPIEGSSILATVIERDRPELEAAIARAADEQGDIAPVDVALVGDGRRSARFYVAAVEDGQQDGEAAVVYAIETSEVRALEEQFARSQKMQAVGQLAGGIAHDFNNVLSAVMMATDFLLNAHKPTDPAFQDIMQIKQNANRGSSLVRQLLAFSRRQTLRPEVLELGEVLADLTILLRRLIGEKVMLEVVHGRDLWSVKADISQFEQVIVNLAVNARDAMPDGGKLAVRTRNVTEFDCGQFPYREMPVAEYVLVEIADTGRGIAPDIMSKIFEPFFSTKEAGKGTGLGLSTVYGIVKQTGGFIFPESEVGRGATFRIFLPRHIPVATEIEKSAALAPITAEIPRPAADLTGQGTILLVEDEAGLRSLNARGLTSRGYTVLEAAHGIDAIKVFDEWEGKIDLVVSDVVMPEMDGPTLLKELRSRRRNIKMMFVSSYAEDTFEMSLPEHGEFTFLSKPFTLKQLLSAVKETMGD
jgi:two-component system cell cycle sensor histidine kinase/response regulator CckA